MQMHWFERAKTRICTIPPAKMIPRRINGVKLRKQSCPTTGSSPACTAYTIAQARNNAFMESGMISSLYIFYTGTANYCRRNVHNARCLATVVVGKEAIRIFVIISTFTVFLALCVRF